MATRCDGITRGFGIEPEAKYGDLSIEPEDFNLSWWSESEDVDFKLNDEPVTRSGGSRMNKKARAGVIKPTGSTSSDADLQRLITYFYGFLDQYKFTAKSGSQKANIHEFYGGECKELNSFRGVAVYDTLIKYLYGLLIDQISIEASNENVTISTDWIYKTEKSRILGKDGATFIKPEDLENDLFLMFYDLSIELNNKALDGVPKSFKVDMNNNHDVDSTIGLGSRAPQKKALAQKRDITPSITTTLESDTVESILAATYGEIGALEPTACKILQVPLKLNVALCEDAITKMTILFPKCTLSAEFDMSGADTIETTLNMDTLGSDKVKLADNTEVSTDIYIRIESEQGKIEPKGD